MYVLFHYHIYSIRGQGIKIYSLVSKQCRKENFLIKKLNMKKILM